MKPRPASFLQLLKISESIQRQHAATMLGLAARRDDAVHVDLRRNDTMSALLQC